jgi:antitoxin VapB
MASKTAKLFRNGASQAVRLPREFRFAGDKVRISRVNGGVLLEPMATDVKEWLATIHRPGDEILLPEGRNQPRAPKRKIFK